MVSEIFITAIACLFAKVLFLEPGFDLLYAFWNGQFWEILFFYCYLILEIVVLGFSQVLLWAQAGLMGGGGWRRQGCTHTEHTDLSIFACV